jgi:hypothetical protein
VPPAGLIVQNKANSSRAIRRASILWKKGYDRLGTQETSAKQSQFPPGQAWARPVRLPVPLAGPVAPNKANLPRTHWNRRGPTGPEVLPLLGTSVRNKANSHPARHGQSQQGCRRHRGDPLCKTKPIYGVRPTPRSWNAPPHVGGTLDPRPSANSIEE